LGRAAGFVRGVPVDRARNRQAAAWRAFPVGPGARAGYADADKPRWLGAGLRARSDLFRPPCGGKCRVYTIARPLASAEITGRGPARGPGRARIGVTSGKLRASLWRVGTESFMIELVKRYRLRPESGRRGRRSVA
jgi:hypothetical protein